MEIYTKIYTKIYENLCRRKNHRGKIAGGKITEGKLLVNLNCTLITKK